MDLKLPEEDLESQLNRSAAWAVTYGDLMSYLMLFFLLMFSFGLSNEGLQFVESLSEVQKAFGGEENKELTEKKAAVVREEQAAEDIQKKLEEQAVAAGSTSFAKVEMTEEKIKITLKDGVLFDPGGVELKVGAEAVLHEVAEFVRYMPNRIVIEGHTDNVPIPKGSKYVSNWVLSMARAYRVLMFFSGQESIPPERLACVGYGEYQPIADNATPEGRIQNRRIEITLVRR